jgi:chromate reductase, NAD(P)H dehydrogenase (quinone)
MHILAVAGSLRKRSKNAAFCRAAARLPFAGLRVTVYAGLGMLPLFNPDLEMAPPSAVLRLRAEVSRADALLIASPEYAHGVSGVLKNALDWLVSFEGFVGKPVAVVNTSPRAHHGHDALLETLRTMSAAIIEEASITVPLPAACDAEEALLACAVLRSNISTIQAAIGQALPSRNRVC